MASELYNKITSSVKDAMKSHDNVRRDCLRTVVSDIKNLTVNAGKDITDDICLKVLQKSMKTHSDSIAQFTAAGRGDLAEKEKLESSVLSEFLPKMLGEDELKQVVSAAVAEARASSKKDIGRVMKALSSRPDSASIDMKAASKLVAAALA